MYEPTDLDLDQYPDEEDKNSDKNGLEGELAYRLKMDSQRTISEDDQKQGIAVIVNLSLINKESRETKCT